MSLRFGEVWRDVLTIRRRCEIAQAIDFCPEFVHQIAIRAKSRICWVHRARFCQRLGSGFRL